MDRQRRRKESKTEFRGEKGKCRGLRDGWLRGGPRAAIEWAPRETHKTEIAEVGKGRCCRGLGVDRRRLVPSFLARKAALLAVKREERGDLMGTRGRAGFAEVAAAAPPIRLRAASDRKKK